MFIIFIFFNKKTKYLRDVKQINKLIMTHGPNPNVLVSHITQLLKDSELKAIQVKVISL